PPSSRSPWPPGSAPPRVLSPAGARPRPARSTRRPRRRTPSDEGIGFSSARTADIGGSANLSDRAAPLTGATSGIGFSAARRLAEQRATVPGASGARRRGPRPVNELPRAAGHERIGFIPVDHSMVAANPAVAEELQNWLGHLGRACEQRRRAGAIAGHR